MAAKSMGRLLNGKINITVPMGLQDDVNSYIKFLSKITTKRKFFLMVMTQFRE